MSSAEIADLLSVPRNGVLTTLGKDGWPHPTAMWFVPEADRLLMWTYRRSQKAVNLSRDPRCAFLVEDGTAYNELRGVLIQGRADVLDPFDEIVGIGRALYERYTLPVTGLPVDDGPIVEIQRQAAKRIGIAIPFEHVASWDHRKL